MSDDLSFPHETPSIPAELPRARLPQIYEAARDKLAECSRIDECQNWADKAEALASYAKQANDDSMRKLADRIQARAIRRAGELMRVFHAPGARTDQPSDGAVPRSQAEAGRQAGLSERQIKTAVRVANVPEADFEAAVESEAPPTVTALAEQGKKPRPLVDLEGIPPEDFARATELQGKLRRLAAFCQEHDPRLIANAFKPYEAAEFREMAGIAIDWLRLLDISLAGVKR